MKGVAYFDVPLIGKPLLTSMASPSLAKTWTSSSSISSSSSSSAASSASASTTPSIQSQTQPQSFQSQSSSLSLPTTSSAPVHRRQDLQLARKFFHFGVGLAILTYWHWDPSALQAIAILAPSFLLLSIIETLRFRFPRIQSLFYRFAGRILRAEESKNVHSSLYFVGAAVITLMIYPKFAAICSLVTLSFCDPAAFFAGKLYGHLGPSIGKKKTLIGTLACMVAGVFTIWGLLWRFLSPTQLSQYALRAFLSVVFGVAAGISEAVVIPGVDDNLSMPIISGFVYTLGLKWAGWV